MQLQFSLRLVKQESESSNSSLDFIQEILTNDFDSNEFKTYNYINKDFYLTPSRAASILPIDLFELANMEKANCSFIYIFIKDKSKTIENIGDLNFTLQIDNSIITCSQFSLLNLIDFNSTVEIISIDIPAGKTGYMTIIMGEKA